jgi:hypothetical protein
MAFGPRLVHPRILNSHANDFSDVINRLELHFPLSEEVQLALQKQILDCGWFDRDICLATFYQLREYHIQSEWVERGYEVLPESRQAFDQRYKHSKGKPTIHGLQGHQERKLLSFNTLGITIDDHHPDNAPETDQFPGYNFIRVMEVRYMPDKLLKGPLPVGGISALLLSLLLSHLQLVRIEAMHVRPSL